MTIPDRFLKRMPALLACVLWIAACGGGGNGEPSDGGSDGGTDGGGNGFPACAAKEFRVEGTVADAPVSESVPVAGHALVNVPGDTGCYVNVYFEGGGRLRLEWPATLPDDQTSQASGSVNLEVQGGINAGDCDDDGLASEVTLLSDGVKFVLRDLHEAPYCTGAPLTGELRGCASFE